MRGAERMKGASFRTLCGALAGVLLSVAPARAADTVYICDLTSYSRWGWVPEKLALGIQEDGRAWAYDGIIKGKHEEPIWVDYEVVSEKRSVFRWVLENVSYSNSPGSISADYRVILNPQTGRVSANVLLQAMDRGALRGQGQVQAERMSQVVRTG